MRMMRERAKFWMLINSMKISFFWVDSDIVFARNFEELLKRPDVQISDMAFMLDSGDEFSHDKIIDRFHGVEYKPHALFEPCGGFFLAKGSGMLITATKATGDFLLRVERGMSENPEV
jgi:Nucleotide-diphospho-sugar transferase